MPFIRTKIVKGQTYYYLVEGVRVDGKVRQRVIAYLGEFETVRSALAYWTAQVKGAEDAAGRKHAREMVAKLKPHK